jgi:hypothetical protein
MVKIELTREQADILLEARARKAAIEAEIGSLLRFAIAGEGYGEAQIVGLEGTTLLILPPADPDTVEEEEPDVE